jgi:tetratricopeptide (TPR) repeat protein
MATKKTQPVDNLQEIESALTRTERFIEENQKIITYVIGGIVLVVVAYLGITRFYIHPQQKEAQSQMFMAENYFERDSFNLALNGDGNYLGFLDIIDNYGVSNAANLAKYYSGISYLKLGQFEEAINYLKKFKTDDLLLGPVKEGALGDAYTELGDQNKALSHYQSAYSMNNNELTKPVFMQKAAYTLEALGKFDDALKLYKEIKSEFPNSTEGRNADKYIALLEVKLGK